MAVITVVLQPIVGLGLIALSVPFGDALRFPLEGLSLTATDALLGLAVISAAAQACATRGAVLRNMHFWIPLTAFLVIGTLSLTIAPSWPLALKELVKWLEFGLAATITAGLVQKPAQRWFLATAVLLGGLFEAGYGLNQAASGEGPLGFLLGGGFLRASGTFGQPNPFAAYLAVVLTVAGGLGIAASRDRFRPLLTLPGLAALLAAGVLVVALAASLSRSGLLALLVGLVVMLVAHDRRMLALLALAMLAGAALGLLGGFGLLPGFITERVSVVFENFSLFDPREVPLTSSNFALVQRMAIWQATWEMFLDNPWTGVGLGNFDVLYPAYALPGWPYPPGHAHNYYLNLLAEAGLLGLGSYLALLAVLARGLWRALAATADGLSTDDALRRGLALAGLGLLAVLTVHHLFDNLYVHSIGVLAGLIVGLALSAGASKQHNAEAPL